MDGRRLVGTNKYKAPNAPSSGLIAVSCPKTSFATALPFKYIHTKKLTAVFNQYGLPPGNDDYSSRTKQVGVVGLDKGETEGCLPKLSTQFCVLPPHLQ